MNILSYFLKSVCSLNLQAREILYYNQMSQVYEQISSFIRTIQPSFQFHSNDLIYCLNAVTQLVKLHPKKAGFHFQELLNILSKMLNEPNHFNLENYADFYEVIIESFCSLPNFSKNNSESISQILRGGVLVLGNISIEVTSDWSHPVESLIGQDSIYSNEYELRICKEVMHVIDSLASQIGYQITRANFMPLFKEYLQFNNDWRLKYGALLIASQIGEGAQNIDDVRFFVDKAITQLQSNEPKVKFACLELIGEYSEQLRPIFQQEYFEIIIPLLLKQLMDNLPRIACHAFASLSNFFSQFNEFWKIQSILNDLLPPMLHYIKTGSPFMQECALQTLFCLASVRGSIGSNLNLLIQACGELIQKCIQVTNQTEVLQQTFQTLSLLLSKQDKRSVQNFMPHFIQSLLLHKDKISDHSFLLCWSNLCLQYDTFVDIDSIHIVDSLLKAVDNQVEEGTQATALISLDCLCNTFKCFTWRMRPYLQTIFIFGKKIFNNSDNFETIRNKALEVIVELLVNIRTQQVPQEDIFMNTAISILQFLIEQGTKCILPDGEMNLLIGVLKGIKSIIASIGSLSRNIVINISSKLISFKQKMEDIFGNGAQEDENGHENQDCNEINSDEDIQDVDECQDVGELFQDLQQILDLIPDVYQSLIKASSQTEKQMLIEDMIPQISFAATKTDEWKLFGLNLALVLVQSCVYQDLSQYWPNLMDLFNSFIDNDKIRLRNQGVFGMGVIFLKTPIELIAQQNVVSWMESLWKSHSTPYDKDTDHNSINYCKDNIMSALGKLIKCYGSHFPHLLNSDLYGRWLQSLPLRHDHLERDCQQEILIELLNENPSVIIRDPSDLKRICEIFAAYTILCIQQKKNSTLKKTKQFFCHMNGWDFFQRSSDYLWNSLSNNQQTAISKLMTYE